MNLQSDKAPLEFMTFNGKNVFLHSAKYLFELALEANKSGRYFPVWGKYTYLNKLFNIIQYFSTYITLCDFYLYSYITVVIGYFCF